MPTKAQTSQIEREEASKTLHSWIKPKDTVYTVSRNRTASGMRRSISLFIIRDGELKEIDYFAARLLGRKFDNNNGGIICNGCGMDMGFDLVYNLGAVMWPEGTETPHGTRNGEPDSTGGYALNHRWI